jgi:hypothetical protein
MDTFEAATALRKSLSFRDDVELEWEEEGQAGPAAHSGSPRAAGPASAWVVEGPPPAGNTGGKLTDGAEKPGLTIKLDWLNTTHPCGQRDEVAKLVSVFLGEPEHQLWGKHTYREHLAWETKAALFWTEGRAECLLSLNGDSLDFIPVEKLRQFLADLDDLKANCTKMDIALDDYQRRVTIEQIEQAFKAKQVCGFRLGQRQNPERWKGQQLQPIGDSFDLGRRGGNGSGKSLKVYDKALESHGEIDAIRWELKLCGERAGQVFEDLCGYESDAKLVKKLTNCVGGCIDFKADPNQTHLDRRPRLAWWQSLLDVLGSARLVVNRVTPPLQKTLLYLWETYIPKLAVGRVIIEGRGGDFLGMLMGWLQAAEKEVDWNRMGRLDLGLDFVALGVPRVVPI